MALVVPLLRNHLVSAPAAVAGDAARVASLEQGVKAEAGHDHREQAEGQPAAAQGAASLVPARTGARLGQALVVRVGQAPAQGASGARDAAQALDAAFARVSRRFAARAGFVSVVVKHCLTVTAARTLAEVLLAFARSLFVAVERALEHDRILQQSLGVRVRRERRTGRVKQAFAVLFERRVVVLQTRQFLSAVISDARAGRGIERRRRRWVLEELVRSAAVIARPARDCIVRRRDLHVGVGFGRLQVALSFQIVQVRRFRSSRTRVVRCRGIVSLSGPMTSRRNRASPREDDVAGNVGRLFRFLRAKACGWQTCVKTEAFCSACEMW